MSTVIYSYCLTIEYLNDYRTIANAKFFYYEILGQNEYETYCVIPMIPSITLIYLEEAKEQ